MALWTPEYIETALWLDAADNSTITESGGAVSAWADKSGNGRDAVQTLSGKYPASVDNAVVFNGSTYLYNTNAVFDLRSFSAFIVCVETTSKASAGAFSVEGIYNDWDSDDGIALLVTGNKSTNNLSLNSSLAHTYWTPNGIGTGSGINRLGTGAIPLGLYGTSFFNLESRAYVDGSALATVTATKTFKAASFGGFSIGCRIGLGSSKGSFPDKYTLGLIGKVYEVVLTDNACDDATRQKIEGYLAHKWGLSGNLPADHPYKSAAPKDHYGTIRDRTRATALHQPHADALRLAGDTPAPLGGIIL